MSHSDGSYVEGLQVRLCETEWLERRKGAEGGDDLSHVLVEG